MSKVNVRIERYKENESYSTTWVKPKTVFEPYSNHKISPLGPKNIKKDPKIQSKSRIERNKENESYSTTWVNPDQCSEIRCSEDDLLAPKQRAAKSIEQDSDS